MIETLQFRWQEILQKILEWSSSPEFYAQAGIAACVFVMAFPMASFLRRRCKKPEPGARFLYLKRFMYELQVLALPMSLFMLAVVGVEVSRAVLGQIWLVNIVEGLAVVWLLFKATRRFVKDPFITILIKWVIIPLATLKVFGWLDDLAVVLDSISIQLGNISLSALNVGRGVVVGILLFWLGRHSNNAGKNAIRRAPSLDIGTRELLAKLFEMGLYTLLFIVLLQVVGINITKLAVLGGAVGVGIGFGLQQIAANFVSGLIILFDRSIKVGDHIELEGDIFGILRDIKLRYAVVETYEGKEVLIPNETFITNIFTNWSGKDDKQRCDFTFSVSYDTDLHRLFDVVREVIAQHPQVISGENDPIEEHPDAEIDDFGDSGIVILVEFWMHGVDDGKNRVEADLKLMLWDALKEHGFTIPFPQREVRILNDTPEKSGSNTVI